MAHLLIVQGGVAGPALQSLMSGKMPPDQQGRLQGAAASLFSVASIVAPVVFTQLFAWTIAASRPAILGATILLGAVLTFSAWCAVAATDADSAKGCTMRAT
jgi:DHA1 family tetracycline resistance protein-like MFS transporter